MTIWLISDTHFGHANILRFTGADGALIRPGFESLEAMHETIVDRWNAVVRPNDHVYHLGDVAMSIPSLQAAQIVCRLSGIKRLVRGNHDKYQTSQYVNMGFKELHGMRRLFDVWLTHAPLHPMSIGRALGNVHGHIHEKPSPPGPYLNVSVEAIAYTPVSLEEVRSRLTATMMTLADQSSQQSCSNVVDDAEGYNAGSAQQVPV
jgi:calcineurin-like phosphoesterase family protein